MQLKYFVLSIVSCVVLNCDDALKQQSQKFYFEKFHTWHALCGSELPIEVLVTNTLGRHINSLNWGSMNTPNIYACTHVVPIFLKEKYFIVFVFI